MILVPKLIYDGERHSYNYRGTLLLLNHAYFF